jgi:hypothetical protein
MAVVCNWVVKLFTAAYLIALFLFLAGRYGWFATDTGPLAGVFLMPLGLPWNRMLDGAPWQLLPWVAAGAPVVNIAILTMISGIMDRSRRV